jgi:hypothetical protein
MKFLTLLGLGLILFSTKTHAFISSPVVSKVCHYEKLSTAQRNEFIKHAFNNFLPDKIQQELSKGISNFALVATNNHKTFKEVCGKEGKANIQRCDKAKKLTDTAYRYDVEMTLKSVEKRIQKFRPAVDQVFKVCPDAGKNIETMMSDFNPSQKIKDAIAQGNFEEAKKETQKMAKLLDVKLQADRVHNPLSKRDPFALEKVYERDADWDCGDILTTMDKVHLQTIGLVGKITSYFKPKQSTLTVTDKK